MTPKQIEALNRQQQKEAREALKKQGPFTYEEALAQTKRSMGKDWRPVPPKSN